MPETIQVPQSDVRVLEGVLKDSAYLESYRKPSDIIAESRPVLRAAWMLQDIHADFKASHEAAGELPGKQNELRQLLRELATLVGSGPLNLTTMPAILQTTINVARQAIDAIKDSNDVLKEAAHAIETPGDFTPEELKLVADACLVCAAPPTRLAVGVVPSGG